MFIKALRTGTLVVAALGGAACTDRLQPDGERPGRSGALIALSGGEGGARYACVSCHGIHGEGNGYDAPRLAGLPAGYLQKQMEDYSKNLRPHPLMRDVARFLSSDERVLVANHYAAMPPASLPPATLDPPPPSGEALYLEGDWTRGLVPCASCHGDEGEGRPGGPPLAGQSAFYLEKQLRDWKAGERRNDGGNVMQAIAKKLADPEMVAVSAYLARRPPAPRPPAR